MTGRGDGDPKPGVSLCFGPVANGHHGDSGVLDRYVRSAAGIEVAPCPRDAMMIMSLCLSWGTLQFEIYGINR